MNRVTLEFPSFQDFLQNCSPFISEEGMFLRTDEVQPVGAKVGFDVGLGSNFPILRGAGEVVWVVEPDPKGVGAPGMALRYTETDDSTQRLIRKIAERHREQTGEIFVLDRPGAPAAAETPLVKEAEEIEGAALAAALAGDEPPADRARPAAPEPVATGKAASGSLGESLGQLLDDEPPADAAAETATGAPTEPAPTPAAPAGEAAASDGDVLSLPADDLAAAEPAPAPAVLPPDLERAMARAEGPSRGGKTGLWLALAAVAIAAIGFWQRDFLADKLGLGATEPAAAGVEEPLDTIDVAQDPAVTEEATPEATAVEATEEGVEIAATEPVEEASAPSPPPQRAPLTSIEDISWLAGQGSTLLMLRADGSFAEDGYQVERLGGDSPREILKISGVTEPYQAGTTDVGTAEVRRVRTGLHPSGLHVVLDLASPDARVVSTEVDGVVLQVRVSTGAGSP